MTIARALRDGMRRVTRAPALLAGVLLLTLLMALPLGLALRGMIAGHLGDSLAAARAATGVNWEWWQEFMDAGGRHRRHVQADDHRLRRGAGAT